MNWLNPRKWNPGIQRADYNLHLHLQLCMDGWERSLSLTPVVQGSNVLFYDCIVVLTTFLNIPDGSEKKFIICDD